MEKSEDFTKTENLPRPGIKVSTLLPEISEPLPSEPVISAHKGRSLADFLDEAACRRAVLESLHPASVKCPECDSMLNDVVTLANFWEGKRCNCKICDNWFTARTGTILQGSQLSFAQVFLLGTLLEIFAAGGISVSTMSAAIGVTDDTIRTWIRRLKNFNDR